MTFFCLNNDRRANFVTQQLAIEVVHGLASAAIVGHTVSHRKRDAPLYYTGVNFTHGQRLAAGSWGGDWHCIPWW